jgi:predicted RNA binding protein YcfA (HicA-like mRNA interferase family)
LSSENAGKTNEYIEEQGLRAERIVYLTTRLVVKRDRKKFVRSLWMPRRSYMDKRQVDNLLETSGTLAIEIQTKSTDEAIHKFYRKKKNRHIIAINPFHYGKDIAPETLYPIMRDIAFYALAHPFESPYEWHYKKEYCK